MQTQVQNEKSVKLGSGILKINGINIGMLEDASFEVETSTAQIIGHNAKLPPRTKVKEAKLKATLLEINIDNLHNLLGGDLTTVDAGSSPSGNERKVLTIDDLIRAVETYPVEFYNTDENGKQWGVKLLNAYVSNGLNLNFPGDEDLESTTKYPIEFTGIADANNKVYEIFDEQTV